jgi:hypothetical protein
MRLTRKRYLVRILSCALSSWKFSVMILVILDCGLDRETRFIFTSRRQSKAAETQHVASVGWNSFMPN